MKKLTKLKKISGIFHLLEICMLLGVVSAVYSVIDFSTISNHVNNVLASYANFQPR